MEGENLEVDWQRDSSIAEGFDAVEPAGYRALVVRRPATEELPILLHQHERLGVPSVRLYKERGGRRLNRTEEPKKIERVP